MMQRYLQHAQVFFPFSLMELQQYQYGFLRSFSCRFASGLTHLVQCKSLNDHTFGTVLSNCQRADIGQQVSDLLIVNLQATNVTVYRSKENNPFPWKGETRVKRSTAWLFYTNRENKINRKVQTLTSRYEKATANSFSSLASSIRLNSSFIVRYITPGSSGEPNMVCVLPAPVAP